MEKGTLNTPLEPGIFATLGGRTTQPRFPVRKAEPFRIAGAAGRSKMALVIARDEGYFYKR